jgi:hypothetical protein
VAHPIIKIKKIMKYPSKQVRTTGMNIFGYSIPIAIGTIKKQNIYT